MPLTKEQKKKIIDNLKEKIARQKAMVFVDFTGVKVKDLSELRKKLKVEDNELKVAKKTLARIAFKDSNMEIDTKKLPGEVALVFSYKNEISAAKLAYQFSRTSPNFKILGGFLENKFKDAEEMIVLAQLPSKEELLSRLVGSIKAPVSNFVYVLKGNIKGLIYVLAKAKTA